MKKLTTKHELIEGLEDVIAVEVAARKGYEQDIVTFKNFKIIDSITKIKKDEDKHIKILEDLIKLLKQQYSTNR